MVRDESRLKELEGKIVAVCMRLLQEERDKRVQSGLEGYPVYTELELEELCLDDISEATLRLGAKVL